MTKVNAYGNPAQPSSAPYNQDTENVVDVNELIAQRRANEIASLKSTHEDDGSTDANIAPKEGFNFTPRRKVAAAIGAVVVASIALGVPNTAMVNLGFRDVPTVTTSENVDQP